VRPLVPQFGTPSRNGSGASGGKPHALKAIDSAIVVRHTAFGRRLQISVSMPPRKPRKSNRPTASRFTPDDILRAIAGVEAAGLLVHEVEITPTGSIKIFTGPRSDSAAREANSINPQVEAKTTKKQAKI